MQENGEGIKLESRRKVRLLREWWGTLRRLKASKEEAFLRTYKYPPSSPPRSLAALRDSLFLEAQTNPSHPSPDSVVFSASRTKESKLWTLHVILI